MTDEGSGSIEVSVPDVLTGGATPIVGLVPRETEIRGATPLVGIVPEVVDIDTSPLPGTGPTVIPNTPVQEPPPAPAPPTDKPAA